MATQKQKRVRHRIRVIDKSRMRNPIAWACIAAQFERARFATTVMQRSARVPAPDTRLIN